MSAKEHLQPAGQNAGKPEAAISIAGSEENGTEFDRLYSEHRQALIGYARNWVDRHDAEDVVRNVFRYYWQRINGDGIPENILAHMRRRTMHRSFNLRRKLGRCVLWDPGAFDFLAQASTRDAVRSQELLEWMIDRVCEPTSRRLIRCLLRGMTLEDIAEEEKVAVGTVKWRIHALRKKMRIRKNSSNLSAF